MSAATSAEAVGMLKSPAVEQEGRAEADAEAPWGDSFGCTAIGDGGDSERMMQNH